MQGISVSSWAIITSNEIRHTPIRNGIINGICIRINTITNIHASTSSNTNTFIGISECRMTNINSHISTHTYIYVYTYTYNIHTGTH